MNKLIDQCNTYLAGCKDLAKIEKELIQNASAYASANELAPIFTTEDALDLAKKLALQYYVDNETGIALGKIKVS